MPSILDGLHDRGFDQSRRAGWTIRAGRRMSTYRPGCSQCQVLVINGVACHESGCAHQVHECRSCSTEVPSGVRYCSDCS